MKIGKQTYYRVKEKEVEKQSKYQDIWEKAEKVVGNESKSDTDRNRNPWDCLQEPGKETSVTCDKRKDRNHPDHSTTKIG